MQRLKQVNWLLITGVLFSLGAWAVLISYARAEQPSPDGSGSPSTFAERFAIGNIQCPDPGVKCKVLFLNEQEERFLMQPNGVLDTAAQARNLDLGQFVVYLKTRIGSAPAGEVKPVKPAPDNNVAQPTDKPVDK